MKHKSIAVPLLCMGVGVGWLLTELNIIPGVNWAWTLGLGSLGVLLLGVWGVDKMTVATGPFFMVASVFSLLRQTGHLEPATEWPAMVIAGGACLLLPYLLPVRTPAWYFERRGIDGDATS